MTKEYLTLLDNIAIDISKGTLKSTKDFENLDKYIKQLIFSGEYVLYASNEKDELILFTRPDYYVINIKGDIIKKIDEQIFQNIQDNVNLVYFKELIYPFTQMDTLENFLTKRKLKGEK